ncbi:MAG: tetratricopeptide repeat protein [Nitrospirae bacterium]|nr:tetratricopeptide repeat protein [Nitrospirota bacterium]
MRPDRRPFAGRPGWIVLAAFLLLPGCVPHPEEPPMGEPPLTRITNRTTDPSQTGQQEASLQLTDQGRQLLASGRWDEAGSVFQKAISLHPNNPYAYYYLAQTRYLEKDYGQSFPPLRQAELYLSGDPSWLARVYALRGRIDEALSKPDDARSQYQKALTFDSRNQDAREGLDRIQNLTAPDE